MSLRKRFSVNGEPTPGMTLHAPYLRPVGVMLAQLKQRMAAGGLSQLAHRTTTEDGATLTVMSRFGQDEIRIDVPQRSGVTTTSQEGHIVKEEEAFRCEWGPNRERYTDIPFLDTFRQSPSMDSRKRVICVRGGGVADQIIVLDADDLTRITQISLNPDGAVIRGNVAVDVVNDQFFIETAAAPIIFDPVSLSPVTLAYPFRTGDWESTDYRSLSANAGAFYTLAGSTELTSFSHELFDSVSMAQTASVPAYSIVNVASTVSPGMGHSVSGGTFAWEVRTLFGAAPGGFALPVSLDVIPLRDGTGTPTSAPSLPVPGFIGGLSAYVVAQNNGSTLWAWVKGAVGTNLTAVRLYRCRQDEWKSVPVEGVNDADVPTSATFGVRTLLAHDPATDAVAVGRNDGTGAWIFNAKDCNYEPIPPFFVRFRHGPTAPFSWGISQFHDASLLVWFSLTDVSPFVTRIGRIDIGRLKQRRVQIR